nr:DNA mismatch repair protein MutS [Anaerolineales bacterium]
MTTAELDPTPLYQQYLEIKRQHPGEILFFRLGDFYETFNEDAQLVARELEIVETSRQMIKGKVRIPMAGLPFHAVDNYVARLIAKGYHVAICEQTGAEAINGLFKREVTRVMTPGTVVEPNLLDAARNNYLAALVVADGRAGLAYADITTGEFAVTSLPGPEVWTAARHELMRLRPAELLVPEGLAVPEAVTVPCTPLPAWKFEAARARQGVQDHFGAVTLAGLGLEGQPLAAAACGAILQYVRETRPGALALLTRLTVYALDDFMTLDAATRRNLELTETLRGGQARGALLGVLDRTVTAMGARLLRHWLHQPLLDVAQIQARLDRVAAFHADGVRRAEVRAGLKPLADVERITNRILGGTANPRDLVALRETLAAWPAVKEKLEVRGEKLDDSASRLSPLTAHFDLCAEVLSLLQAALADEPPAVLSRPGVIRAGYAAELDGVLEASR